MENKLKLLIDEYEGTDLGHTDWVIFKEKLWNLVFDALSTQKSELIKRIREVLEKNLDKHCIYEVSVDSLLDGLLSSSDSQTSDDEVNKK